MNTPESSDEKFKKALDIFSCNIMDPLFPSDLIEKESTNVDSE